MKTKTDFEERNNEASSSRKAICEHFSDFCSQTRDARPCIEGTALARPVLRGPLRHRPSGPVAELARCSQRFRELFRGSVVIGWSVIYCIEANFATKYTLCSIFQSLQRFPQFFPTLFSNWTVEAVLNRSKLNPLTKCRRKA